MVDRSNALCYNLICQNNAGNRRYERKKGIMAFVRNSLRLLSMGLVLLGVGIAVIVMISAEMADYSKKGVDYSELSAADYKEGMMVEGELPYNLGCYEVYYEEKDNGQKKAVGNYYLIFAGNEGFMGLYTPRKDLMSQLDRQADEWDLDDYESITPVHFKGKVMAMDSDDKRFLDQALSGFGYTDEEIEDYAVYLYIKCIDTGSHPVLLGAGIAAAVAGLVFLLLYVRRKMMGR